MHVIEFHDVTAFLCVQLVTTYAHKALEIGWTKLTRLPVPIHWPLTRFDKHTYDVWVGYGLELSDNCDLSIIMIVSNNHENDSMQSYYRDISKHLSQT